MIGSLGLVPGKAERGLRPQRNVKIVAYQIVWSVGDEKRINDVKKESQRKRKKEIPK